MVNGEDSAREAAPKSNLEQKGQGAAVNARTIGIRKRQRGDLGIFFEREGQFAQVTIHNGTHNQGIRLILDDLHEVLKRCAALASDDPAIRQDGFDRWAWGFS